MALPSPARLSPPASSAVYAIGAANVDIAGHADRPPRPGDSTPGRVAWSPGGVARNVAARLAALQPARPVRLISAVGRDAWGRQLREATRRAGVDVAGVATLAAVPTSVYLSLHGPDGEMVAAVNAMPVQDRLDAARLRRHAAALHAAAAWFVDANLCVDALGWLLRHRPRGLPVFADAVSVAKCERLRSWLPALHTLKLNRDEAGQLVGRALPDRDAARDAAMRLLDAGPRQVALSLGADGMLLSYRARDGGALCVHQPAWPAAVTSVTGAGDAMMAALLHAHLQRWPARRAAAFAVAAATCALEAPAGGAAPSAREVWARSRRGAPSTEKR